VSCWTSLVDMPGEKSEDYTLSDVSTADLNLENLKTNGMSSNFLNSDGKLRGEDDSSSLDSMLESSDEDIANKDENNRCQSIGKVRIKSESVNAKVEIIHSSPEVSSEIEDNNVLSLFCSRVIPFLSGLLLTVNFLIFWALPVAGMGAVYKYTWLKPVLQSIYFYLESHPAIRDFAKTYIYTKPEHADFFVMLVLLCLSTSISVSAMFYVQLTTGSLPSWLICAYYLSWVGIGGNIMGTAYALSHKEGHYHGMYKKWFKDIFGNFVENWVGLIFGNVPYNFTTSHVFIHHRLDGSAGDSFYMWDFDRSSLAWYMIYVHRVLLHMVGYSSIVFFNANGKKNLSEKLFRGVCIYWTVAAAILAATRSASFLFWFYIEPLLCMTFFLALINIGFHGFIEFDRDGKSIPMVNSTTIVDSEDDFFGEFDHMAHHYSSHVYYRDLPALQESKKQEFARSRASVFRNISIIELSLFILLGLWDKLADHYVDYNEPEDRLSRQQVKDLLRSRVQRCEASYEAYQAFARHPTEEARRLFLSRLQVKALSPSEPLPAAQ